MDINLAFYLPSIGATHVNNSQYWTNKIGVNTYGVCYSNEWIHLISGESEKFEHYMQHFNINVRRITHHKNIGCDKSGSYMLTDTSSSLVRVCMYF